MGTEFTMVTKLSALLFHADGQHSGPLPEEYALHYFQ